MKCGRRCRRWWIGPRTAQPVDFEEEEGVASVHAQQAQDEANEIHCGAVWGRGRGRGDGGWAPGEEGRGWGRGHSSGCWWRRRRGEDGPAEEGRLRAGEYKSRRRRSLPVRQRRLRRLRRGRHASRENSAETGTRQRNAGMRKRKAECSLSRVVLDGSQSRSKFRTDHGKAGTTARGTCSRRIKATRDSISRSTGRVTSASKKSTTKGTLSRRKKVAVRSLLS